MSSEHLTKLDEEITAKEAAITDDQKKMVLLKDNIKMNQDLLKILKKGREKLNGNSEQKEG